MHCLCRANPSSFAALVHPSQTCPMTDHQNPGPNDKTSGIPDSLEYHDPFLKASPDNFHFATLFPTAKNVLITLPTTLYG